MAGNRVEAEKVILQYITKLLPGSKNPEIYRKLFAEMDDNQFDEFMIQLESGKTRLALIAPNLTEPKITIERNLEIAKELGHSFFERIWLKDHDDLPAYLSEEAYLIVDLPLRRQAQILEKKIRIPEDNKVVDDLTGQPTGTSKGSKISYPEIQVMASMNLEQCLTEWLKYRGGDTKGFNAMNDSISKTGGVSMEAISHLAGGVKSKDALSIMLTCMHLSNTL